jgi:hypothetical protein
MLGEISNRTFCRVSPFAPIENKTELEYPKYISPLFLL